MPNDSSHYAKLLKDAEDAVSGLKNDKLREIAFEKLLSHFLNDSEDEGNDEGNGEEIKVVKSNKKARAKKSRKKSSSVTRSSKEGPRSWLDELVEEGFFKKPKSANDILGELKSRSHHLKPTDITSPLQKICHDKLLRRITEKAETSGKSVLHWVKW